MVNAGHRGGKTGYSSVVLFVGIVATVFVAERYSYFDVLLFVYYVLSLWQLTHETRTLVFLNTTHSIRSSCFCLFRKLHYMKQLFIEVNCTGHFWKLESMISTT